jgi:hypothetical protein
MGVPSNRRLVAFCLQLPCVKLLGVVVEDGRRAADLVARPHGLVEAAHDVLVGRRSFGVSRLSVNSGTIGTRSRSVSRYAFGPSPNNLRILAKRLRIGQLYSPPIGRAGNLRRNLGEGPGVEGSHARRSE